MKIRKSNFKALEQFYECKVGIESIKKALANLEYYAQHQVSDKTLLAEINKAHKILNEIEFEK